jgi:pyrroloquinoline quinone (PQQ) biosynthesis protein C
MLEALPHHSDWFERVIRDLRNSHDRVVCHTLFAQLRDAVLPVSSVQVALINFYPLIESFPKYMGLMLGKVPMGSQSPHHETRQWLSVNINQERRHTEWWVNFAEGFGVDRRIFSDGVLPPPEMDAINHYLWHVCSQGSLVEAIAATNYAVEGATGEWTKFVRSGLESYSGRPGIKINSRTLAWVNAHASYDDEHPREAAQIIGAYAKTPEQQKAVKLAIGRSWEYYAMALDQVLRQDSNP